LLHHQHQRYPLGIVQACPGHGHVSLKASRTSKVVWPETGSEPAFLRPRSLIGVSRSSTEVKAENGV
jgi:hypothetical protein